MFIIYWNLIYSMLIWYFKFSIYIMFFVKILKYYVLKFYITEKGKNQNL